MSEQNIISAIAASNGTNYLLTDATKSAVSVDMLKTDVNLQHISQEDYEQLVEESATVSNWVYFVSSEYEDAYGQQIKNMAPGTDLSDAVNLEQLTEVSSRAYDTYTQSEVDLKIASAQYFKKYVVQTLPPVADADVRGIYLVPSQDQETQNTYDEYVVVGEGASKSWEKIGAKNIDLSGYKTKQTSVPSPTASDSATAFIDTISQDENGVITATKKNVQSASTSLAGIVLLNNTLTSTSTTQAATANTVKTLNDTKLGNTGALMIAPDSAQNIPGALGIQADSSNSLMLEVSAMTLFRPGSGLTSIRFYKLELPEKDGVLATKGDIPDVSGFSSVSVDNLHADVNLQHISQADYEQLVVDDEVLSNALYVVSSDYVETYGQQIKNVADPTDLSDAVNKKYVDSNFLPAGSYLTAVPDAYKTYAATLSSLSSTYSLTSHTHTSYVPTSRTVVGQLLTENVTAATISSAIGLSNYALNISVLHKTGDETAAGKKTFSDAFTVGTRKSGTYGTKSFTYGLNNLASGEGSFAGGQNCVASEAYAVAEGYLTSALGLGSHAEGLNTLAKGGSYCSHAEGYKTVALNGYAHAEGYLTSANFGSHAEGSYSFAHNIGHAEGEYTYANGYASHAENGRTSALANYAHAEGFSTLVQNTYEHAQGTYNVSNRSNALTFGLSSNTIDSVGIGRSDAARKNATEVMQNGDAYFLGVGGYDGTNAVSATSKPLAAVLSAMKSYADTKDSLSSDGYATQTLLDTKSAISVDNEHADTNILHISQEEYNLLVVDDEVLSNVVYVISSDYIDVYGQQIKNLAPGTDLSDAVNVEQLNNVLSGHTYDLNTNGVLTTMVVDLVRAFGGIVLNSPS